MPRNTKKIIIGLVILIVVTLIVIGVLLYTLTDIFKPANYTFLKYASQNIDVFSSMFNLKEESDYINKLETNKYESSAVITANMNLGDQKDLSDIINKFVINLDTKSDKLNDKEYKKLALKYDNNDIINLEYNKQDDIYGVKFSDVVTKYVSVQNKDLKALAEKAGIDSSNVPDKIENYSYDAILSEIRFTEEEKEQLKKEYGTIIINNIPKDNFTKQKKQMITVDGNTITANAYVLNTNKQQLKELLVKILEQLSNDQIILNKIDTLDAEIAKTEELDKTLRDQYNEQILQMIDELNNDENKEVDSGTNIKITVYENKKKLIRTAISTDYIKTNIDVLKSDTKTTINIQADQTTEEDYKSFVLKLAKNIDANTQDIIANLQVTENDKTYSGEIERIRKAEGSNLSTEIKLKASKDNNQYELNYKNDISIVDNTSIEELLDKNNIILNDQSAENIERIKNIIYEQQSAKFLEKMQPILLRIYAETPITDVQDVIEDTENNVKVSDTDRNAFNAKFEGYTGNKVKNVNIQTLLTNLKNYASEIKIDDMTGEIAISIKKDIESPVSLDEVNAKIDTTKTYTVNLEYDSENIANRITIKANS